MDDIEVRDLVAAFLAATVTFSLFAAFDTLSGGGINWALDAAIALGVGATTVYFRVTEPEVEPDD